VQDAINVLKFSPRRAASMISKVLNSAIANANENEADVEELYVQEVRVDEGPTMKRFRPKDRGRSHPIMKRTSHIVVVVEEESEEEAR
jgi:large subunit ribosomal protein L22